VTGTPVVDRRLRRNAGRNGPRNPRMDARSAAPDGSRRHRANTGQPPQTLRRTSGSTTRNGATPSPPGGPRSPATTRTCCATSTSRSCSPTTSTTSIPRPETSWARSPTTGRARPAPRRGHRELLHLPRLPNHAALDARPRPGHLRRHDWLATLPSIH
jgi:hypothetical protein